jgi:predicted KAP-like P-loop ATPase
LSYVPALSLIGTTAKAVTGVGIAAEKAGEEELRNISAVKNELSNLLKDIDTKMIIVIDDIDRLTNTEIRQIFQLVKSLADFPNTIYLLSFDKDVVINALKKVQEGSGHDYLEKVVQVPFEIPQISYQEIENFLFKNLEEIIHDIPEERWDQTYWGNIYHSGLRHLFHNIRDVNRYLNSLRFGLNLVKNEVNPIDFIAIVAVQVFIPNLYKSIKENKELFTGIRDRYSGSKNAQKEEARIELILNHVDELPPDILKDFLQRLFPRMENVGYSHSFLESWRKKGRICSPDIFDTYFKLFIPKDEISLNEIERILSTGNDVETFSKELLKLNEDNKIIRFLERMEDYTRDDIPEGNIVPIVNTLMDLGDMFPKGSPGWYTTDTPMRILRLFYQLTHRYQEHEKRSEIFANAISNAKNSLYTIVNEIDVQCQQHGKYGFKEKPEPSEKTTVSPEQLDKLVILALKRIEDWAVNGKLAEHGHLLPILFTWRRWSDPQHVRDYVRSSIQSDNDLVKFIQHFLSDVRSHGLSDYVEKVNWQINLESVEAFVNLEEVDKRLRKIQSSPLYDELDEKGKQAIEIFLDTRDGKIEDRF